MWIKEHRLLVAIACAGLLVAGNAGRAAEKAEAPAAAEANAEPVDPDATEAELEAQRATSDSFVRDLAPSIKPMYDVGADEAAPKGKRIAFDTWVNRKDLTYRVGDTLAVSVKPKSDAYITILNVGSSGAVTLLYPNHFQRDAKVKAGTTVRIPSKKAKWQISVGGPRGVDLVKVIASKKPLTLKELQNIASADEANPVITLGRSAEEAARDLSPQLKPEQSDDAEAQFGVRSILVRVKKEVAND